MTIYEQLIAAYPELENSMELAIGSIRIQDDGDGAYIAKWEYSKPFPNGLKLGK